MTWLIAKAYPDAIPDDLKEIFLEDENVDTLLMYVCFYTMLSFNLIFNRANGF